MEPSITIDSFGPLPVQRPASVAELRDLVSRTRAAKRAVYPAGGRTALDYGLPPGKPGVACDTTALDAVLDYPARDMTITAQAGITLPRTSFQQYGVGVAVPKAQIEAGDLVFFDTAGAGASHVGVATSPTTAISATTHGVQEHRLDDGYWGGHFVGARRVTG